jgi:hypothetical protein
MTHAGGRCSAHTREVPPAKLGPFEVVRELGAGGVGVVYAVKEPLTGRTLALKLLHDEGRDSTALERFEREAEVLARVHHRSVVRVHKTGRLREGSYLLQALVEGESLKALCARGPLPPRRAAEVARELADALAAVHAAGVLHRDLKPANVILQPDGIPVLLDFGVARDQTAERLTRTGTLLGSASYMAPEQAEGASPSSLDGRTDVYGLGATLYELLTGEPPFTGMSLEVLQAVLARDPPWPRSLRPEVPEALDVIVRRAMAKSRDDRHPDMAALRDDLGAFLAGGRAVQAGRSPRFVVAGLLLGAAALGLAVAAAMLVAARPEPLVPPAQVAAIPTHAEPAPTPASAPAPAPLWSLAAGAPIDLAFEYEESDDLALVAFEGVLRLTPGATSDAGRRAAVDVELRAVKIGLGSRATGIGASYDTRDPTPGHPLAAISGAIGGRLTCALDPVTGRFDDVRGAIPARVDMLAFGKMNMVDARTIKQAVRSLLGEGFFSRFLDGMLHVREAQLPWTPAPAGSEGLEFLLAPKDPVPQVVPSALEPALKARTPVRITGRTLYRDGLPREATLTQHDERGKERGRGQARWTLRLDPR